MTVVVNMTGKIVGLWKRFSTATRLLVVLDLAALLVIATLLSFTSTIVARRIHVFVDTDLEQHISAFRTVFAWERFYLSAEARTMARLDGIDEALLARDGHRLRRLLTPVQLTHALDAVYVVTADGQVLASLGEAERDLATVTALDMVQKGIAGQNFSQATVAGQALWLAGVAPHVGAEGQVDAAFLLVRRLDHDYLAGLKASLGPEIILTDGSLVVSSLSPEHLNPVLASGFLSQSIRPDEFHLHDVSLGSAPYRLLVGFLDPTGAPGLTAGLLQPAGFVEDIIRQTIGQIVGLGFLLVAVTFALIYFLIRTVFHPLQSLRQAAEIMAAGDLSQPVRVRGTVEVEALALTFDQMRSRLQMLIEAQRSWTEELEAQVQARTRELRELCDQRDRLLVKLISAQEEERQRVARELHDETSQVLANLVVTLGAVARLTADADTRQRLNQVKGLAVEALEDVKRIILDLRPSLLDDYGLQAAIRWYVEERLSQAGIAATIEVHGTEVHLPPHIETGLFRVVQEGVNNIARHSRAAHAWIRLIWEPTGLAIEVEDDGQGFDVQEALSGHMDDRGLGLLGMQERVELVGGSLTIKSVPQTGTCIFVQVPVSQRMEPHV